MRITIPLRDLETADARPRDTTRPIILVGFQDQANLGIGYVAAVLRRSGYTVHVCDFKLDRRQILETARRQPPLLVGFSLIFQFYVHRFHELAAYLRENGVNCHFTMGGHFPSLSYRAALDARARSGFDRALRRRTDRPRARGSPERGPGVARRAGDCLPERTGRRHHAAAPAAARSRRAALPGSERGAAHHDARPRRGPDPGQPRLRPHLFLLFDSHLLPDRTGQDGPHAAARGSGQGDARPPRPGRRHDLPLPGR